MDPRSAGPVRKWLLLIQPATRQTPPQESHYLAGDRYLCVFRYLLSQSSLNLDVFNADIQQRFPLLFFAALTILIFLLFVALTFVLARNLLKLFAERRLGVLGSKFRTRLVVGGLLLSFLPVIMMFWFAYGLMNNSIEQWFSRPWKRCGGHGGRGLAGKKYAAQNARAKAESIAAAPERNGPSPVIAFPARTG